MSAFVKIGNWVGMANVAANLEGDFREAMKKGLMKVGLKAEGIAVKHLQKQDLDWEALKERTIKSKEARGTSGKILIDSSDYMQSITSFVKDNTAFAGVKKDAKNKEGDVIASIAAVHEFGSVKNNIPARPLWAPTNKETEEWMKKEQIFSKLAWERINKRKG